MSTKHKGFLLAAIYILLIALAIPLHTQKGVEWNGRFYRQSDATVFTADKNNRFSYEESEHTTVFDLTVNGYVCRAEMTKLNENTYRFDFSDGFTVLLPQGETQQLTFSDGTSIFLSPDKGNCLIINRLSQTPLTFSPYTVEESPFYDGKTGQTEIGKWITYKAENGEHIYGWETWYDGSYSGHPPAFVTLTDGAVIDRNTQYDGSVLYVNEQNEILTNTELLSAFPYQYGEDRTDRRSHCHLLINTAVHENISARGHAAAFFLSLVYFLGAAQFLWPEQLAFFGSRWQYLHEPELSDAGLAMTKFSAVFLMLISILPLFLPLFL